ncbi:MAG: uridine kinase [Candidatus Cloacimonetes bacterium]|jgi:uridine kinase|nr:uridine kinase [Candidatus Cloacimonadota bacterium]MBT7469435.1 uridine kinase [Candidatus Cloacimonadota bacterium]
MPLVIGIAGGTGSGKSTIADAIQEEVRGQITILKHDNYYRNFKDLSFDERAKLNYDHPKTFETELLIEHIKTLKNQVPIETPVYDFEKHLRTNQTIRENPSKIIIVEGILIFENKELRDLLDIKIFVDTDADIRILRRIQRDMDERGRSLESVLKQYRKTVRPMHIEFVEPSKRFADVIIPEGGYNKIGIDMILAKVKSVVN